MAWYHEAVFYHIYPLGLLGAEKTNDYSSPHNRLSSLAVWIRAAADLGMSALYIGPVFESVGHGYETTDYRKIDSRIGTNDAFHDLVEECHKAGLKVVLDAVFNHTGRDFFAFRDLLEKRESSRFRYWYKDVDFRSNNSYQDGFRYATWGGYDLLPKLDLSNPEVRRYHIDTVQYWIDTFDIDGLRLDAADQLDFGFLHELRSFTDSRKPDFWLLGEVIHGDYSRWVNENCLHSVTDYALYKALYSAHNDKNYFEIAHTIQRHRNLGIDVRGLYHFSDNHDVDRIISRLNRPDHWLPLQILLFTLPGIPSVYYGSEYGIPGKRPMATTVRSVPPWIWNR